VCMCDVFGVNTWLCLCVSVFVCVVLVSLGGQVNGEIELREESDWSRGDWSRGNFEVKG